MDKEVAQASIFDYLQTRLKINIGFSDIYFYIDFLNDNEANYLDLNAQDPCMRHELTFYTSKGEPLITPILYTTTSMLTFYTYRKLVSS